MTASSQLRSPLPRSARRAGTVFVWVLIGATLLVVACGVWIGVRGVLAAGHLRDAQQAATRVVSSLSDPAAATAGLDDVARETAAARALTGDAVWAAATAVPWVGEQLLAVRTAVAAVDDVAGEALRPLAASGVAVSAFRPVDGRFDVAALTRLQEPAATAAAGTRAAVAAVEAIPTGALLAPLAAQVDDLLGLLRDAAGATDALHRATRLMPAVLGADGPRNYLVVFQNNAEWRSLGGIAGALALIRTDGGSITLAAQASATQDFDRYGSSIVPLTEEQVGIFGQKPGQYMQNVTQVPSFPLAAKLAQAMWADEFGVWVDGVVAVDPVTLSYLLEATGPITLPTGDVLTSENAVPLLLNEVYQRYPSQQEQDAFFEAAAASVFSALSSGAADPARLVSALATAGAERRMLVWNANEQEQAVLAGTTLEGVPTPTDAQTTAFGVYLNDGTGSKMDFYAHAGVGVAWCTDTEGSPDAALTVTLRSDAPADPATLSSTITGGGGNGVAPGITRTVAYLYLPAGSEIVFSASEGPSDFPGFSTGTDGGRPVLIWTTDLPPGTEATARVRVRTPLTPELLAEVTPVLPSNVDTTTASCAAGG